MKKIIISVLSAALVFASCQKEAAPVSSGSSEVSFTATIPQTRTSFAPKEGNSYPVLWTGDEKVGVSYNFAAKQSAAVAASADGKTASFEVAFEATADVTDHNFYAVCPYSAFVSASAKYSSLTIEIPSTQTPVDGSCDEAAQIIVAKHESSSFDEKVKFDFNHVVAYGNLSVKLPSGVSGISSITLSSEEDIAGRIFYYPADGSYQVSTNSTSITLNTDKTSEVFFACLPVDLSNKSLKVVVAAGGNTYTKNIDLTGKTLKFEQGRVSKFSVDMSGVSADAGEPLPEAAASTVKDFIDRKDTNTQYVLTGTASECAFGTSYWGFVLTDETGSVQCPFPANWDEFKDQIKDGSTVKIQGAYSYYEDKDADQLKNGTILSVTGGAPAEQHVYEGIVVAVSKVAFLIKTEDSYKYAYDKEKVPAVALGDMVKLSGELSMYGNLEEVINYTVEVLSSGNAVNHPEITKLSGADMDTYETVFGYVGFTGKLSISGNYYNVTVEGSTKTGSLANANNVDAALNGKIVDCEGYFIGLTGKDKYFNIILTSIKASDDQSGSDPGEGGNPGGGGETGNWTRVTTVAELLAGGTFIIGYEATANSGIIIPMANTGSASTDAVGYIYSGSTAVAGGKETINMSSVSETSNYEVTIVPSTSVSGAICIKLGANYLGNTNTKNNCKLFTTEATTTAFTPTVGDNDVFTLTIEANDSYNTLQYNAGSPRFAVYKATQKNVVIYKKNK